MNEEFSKDLFALLEKRKLLNCRSTFSHGRSYLADNCIQPKADELMKELCDGMLKVVANAPKRHKMSKN